METQMETQSMDSDAETLQGYLQEQDNLEWMALCKVAVSSILMYYENYIEKVPCRTSIRTGHILIKEILDGNEARCYQDFRVTKTVFMNLCTDLNTKYELHPTRMMTIHEEVGIFLMTCAHGVGNRIIQEMFNHSGETIHRHFHRVLVAMNKLAKDVIKSHPNYNDGAGYHKTQNERYLPFFKDCIGAIDGTHVAARLPRGQEISYFGRKGYTTQNILAVVDFNMCFTFAWVGWEGSAHDARIFGEALRRRNLNFPKPTGDKYYLVDGGYSHTKGFMGPYKGSDIRYHLAEFRRARTRQQRQPRNIKEKFNFLHSSCRNIVERTFGVWKARFLILKNMPNYDIDIQTDIVIATMAIHNYIRNKGVNDNAFDVAVSENYVPSNVGTNFSIPVDHESEETGEGHQIWMEVRNEIAREIAQM